MVHNRFQVLAEEDGQEGVDDLDFFGGESDTESLADPQHDEPDPPMPAIPVNRVQRVVGAFAELDVVDLTEEFERRTRIMRTVPYVMRGAYREAMRVALDHISSGRSRSDVLQEERGWKLFLLIPRLLLFRPGRRGLIPKRKLEERANRFAAGQWLSLLAESNKVASDGSATAGEDVPAVTRRRHCAQNDWRLWVNCLPHGELSKEQRLHQAL